MCRQARLEKVYPLHFRLTNESKPASPPPFLTASGAQKQKLTEEVLRRMYIICVATYLYLRIVTFHMNRKIRRENNTYRKLSEDPASVPPNCHVSYEQETRRENNIQR